MEPLEVLLFGGFRLRRGEETVPPVPARAARTLLAYLAVNRGIRHPRERLVDRFWPELPANRGRRRLSHTLWQAQDALSELRGDVDYLDVSTDAIGFSPDAPCIVDVEEFTRGLDRARERRSAADARVRDLTDLESTVAAYRGEFLAGHEDPWVVVERERLHQRYVEALGWLVGLAKAHTAYEDALVYARRLTNEDPLREDAHREVMRLSVLLGRSSDAIRQFERVREVLADELGTEPSAETLDLYRRLVEQRRPGMAPTEPTPLPERVPLVGRDPERDIAVTVLERALGGHGGALLVEGDAGVGTSRLLDEVVEDAHWRGFSTARSGSRGHRSRRAYGVVQDLLDEGLTRLRVEQLRPRVGAVWLAEAAKLAPAIEWGSSPAAGARPAELASLDSAQRMREALSRVLVALAEIDPLLLVIDDAHVADLESLEVLAGVAEQLSQRRLVVLAGYRREEARADDDVWTALRGLDRALRPERVQLTPLDVFSTGELVRVLGRGFSVASGAVQRLHRETGGNPRFLVETIRSLSEEQRLDMLGEDDPSDLPIPSGIWELLDDRLGRLTPEPRTVLELTALAGDPLDLEVLALASDLPRETLVEAVDGLVRRSFLAPVGERFVVHHEQLRRVAVSALDDEVERATHRRLASALQAVEPEATERLARHFEAGGSPQQAVGYLHRSGQAAAEVHAYAVAADLLQRARGQLALTPASISTRVEVLTELEGVLDVLGDRESQRELLDELTVLTEGVPAREVEVARRRALLSGHLGDVGVGREAADHAVAVAEQLDEPDVLADSLVARASVAAWSGQLEDATDDLERAVATAVSARVALSARAQLGSVLRELQRYDQAVEVLDVVLETASRWNAVREEVVALGVLGAVRMETGDADQAIELYSRGIDRAVAIGYRRGEAVNRVNRANASYASGALADAFADQTAAAELFSLLGDERGEAATRVNRASLLHEALGDDRAARAEAERALAFFAPLDDPLFAPLCRELLAGIDLRSGDLAGAREHLERAEDAQRSVWAQLPLARRRAELELAEGQPGSASQLLEEAISTAQERGLSSVLPSLRAIRAAAFLELGDPASALEEAQLGADALHSGVERGYLVRHQFAVTLAAAGRWAEADAAATAARRELESQLDTLGPDDRATAELVPGHRSVLAGLPWPAGTWRQLTVASREAPLGRPLKPDERMEVHVDTAPVDGDPPDPVERRRTILLRVTAEIDRQGGAPTVGDLADALEVSPATVRRDLATLRDQGVEVPTRGVRAG